MRGIRERRTHRRMVSILATIGLVAGMLALLAPGANASKGGCAAKNTTTGKNYGNLQKAINAAASGTTLEVRGRCAPDRATRRTTSPSARPSRSWAWRRPATRRPRWWATGARAACLL
jgi:hypothetical protein